MTNELDNEIAVDPAGNDSAMQVNAELDDIRSGMASIGKLERSSSVPAGMLGQLELYDQKGTSGKLDENQPGEVMREMRSEKGKEKEKEKVNAEGDAFELKTGHKVTSSNGAYRISDQDGNFVKITEGGVAAVKGKIASDHTDKAGNRVIKFENGSAVIHSSQGRVTVFGSNGESASFRINTAPAGPFRELQAQPGK